MILKTKRLKLREYNFNDFNELYKILSDKETMKYYPKPYDEKGAKRWIDWSIENYQKHGFGWWAIELLENNKFIGDCGITIQNIDGNLLPEIGYHINKLYWNNGYAKEAAKHVRDWFFTNTNYENLYSYTTIDNIYSSKTALSIGMKKIKEFKEENILYVVYELNRKDWQNLH